MRGILSIRGSHGAELTSEAGLCPENAMSPYIVLLVSAALCIFWFLITAHLGLNLWDEGYLWHDTYRTLHGGVPVRDFRSYDPGRYYWGAFWCSVLGEGIFSLRISIAILHFLGMVLGLLVARRVVRTTWGLVSVGVFFLAWLYPRDKTFEHALVLASILCAVRLIENPRLSRHFLAGVLVGVAAFFGKNLGVFFAVTFVSLIWFVGGRSRTGDMTSRFGLLIAGVVMGYLPMVGMVAFVPGFATSFLDSVVRLAGPSAPVKPLPIPFPWTASFSPFSGAPSEGFLLGCAFLVAVAFYSAVAYQICVLGRCIPSACAVVVGSFFVGFPLFVYFFSRADFAHFAICVSPLFLGLIGYKCLLGTDKRLWWRPVLAVLCAGLFAIGVMSSPEVRLVMQRIAPTVTGTGQLVQCQVLDDTLWLEPEKARRIETLRSLLGSRVGHESRILIAP